MFKLLVLLCISKTIFNILIGIDGKFKKHCISKWIDVSDVIHINYIVTGEESSEKTTVKIFNPNNKLIFERNNEADGKFMQETKESGNHKMCFYPQSTQPHFISFEYYTQYERGHTLDMAKDCKSL
jgi:hypothetical protein